MKVKNTEDLEDVIKILIDLLKDKKISHDEITLKLRENHYCINCKQHFNRCKCDESESPSDLSDSSESPSDSYESDSPSDFSESESSESD
jgi:hypothetical protein